MAAGAGTWQTRRNDLLLTSPPGTAARVTALPGPASPAPVSTVVAPATSSPIPPPRPVPATLADRSPTPNQFPLDTEAYNEKVGATLRHRSGGPYLTETDVRQRALKLARCSSDVGDSARCDGAVVKFFETYASAYQGYGTAGWQYRGGFGHDREVYLVTVYGALPFCPRVPIIGPDGCPMYRDHDDVVIDATTGEPS